MGYSSDEAREKEGLMQEDVHWRRGETVTVAKITPTDPLQHYEYLTSEQLQMKLPCPCPGPR
jgi:hypothetical protein